MTIAQVGYDQILRTAPDGTVLCHSLGCARRGRLAGAVVTFGVLNDPGASIHAPGALWRESWGQSYPMCGACWEQTRQVAAKYRPGLAVIDAAPLAAPSSGGRA